ncbi:hypothetical protein C7S18_19175 [Ahniella affigens]|uniref:Uncharacterized protein n=1 Tax=Ahniella affigens TaxID=2021234 RepID=A0A2P1PWE7_9GAMM|nr:hypothetical protein [Ahniella affigens]AVP99159.1 hypothetical protein C7S18_19175 [Ahniella affigens]
MTNPFGAPNAKVGTVPAARRGDRTILITGLLLTTFSATVISLVVPRVAAFYEALGSALPILTLLCVQFYLVAWLMPVLVVAIAVVWPTPTQRTFLLNVFGIMLPIAILPLVFFALYLPMLQLAETL